MPKRASLRKQRRRARSVSASSRPAAGSSSSSTRGRKRERARDLDQALVDVRQRAGERVERAAIADEGEQALGERARLARRGRA